MSDPNGWVPIGPSCVPNGQLGKEQSGEGPVSGRCTAIALDPGDPDETIYAGTAIGGVWKSMDGGLTWLPKSDSEACLGIGCITIDPTNRLRLYVGTGEANEGSEIVPGVGVLFSEDGGDHWSLRGNATLAGKWIGQILVDPLSPVNVYAATSHGLYHSPDSGVNWDALSIPPWTIPWLTGLHMDASDPANKRLYAAVAQAGVYRREGAGNFERLSNNSPPPSALAVGIYRIALAVAPSDQRVVYAAFDRASPDASHDLLGVWRSANGRDRSDLVRWERVGDLPLPLGSRTGQTSYNLVLSVDPTDPDRVFLGEVRLWRSNDGGRSWELVSEPHGNSIGLHADQHALVFHPTETNKVWAGNDGGVFYSSDGGTTWTHRNRGLQTLQFYALALHPSRENLALAGSQDNGMLRYLGHAAWQRVRGGDGFYCAIDPVEPTRWYGSHSFRDPSSPTSSAIYASTQAGQEGTFVNIADDSWLLDYADRGPFYVPFVHSPTEPGVVYVGTTRLYRSKVPPPGWESVTLADGAPFTTAVTEGTLTKRASEQGISAIAVSRSNSSVVYVGTADGRFVRLEQRADGLWLAGDRSAGLPAVEAPIASAGSTTSGDVIADIAVHPTNPDHVYVAIGSEHRAWRPPARIDAGRIFFSQNGGQTWLPRGNSQMDVRASGITIEHLSNPVNAVIVDPAHPTHVYIGCDVGVFRSTDEGANWAAWSENLPNSSVSDLQIHEPTRMIRATTRGRSVWERRLDAPAAVPPLIDLYVRDNRIDVARRDTPPSEADPLNPSQQVPWDSSVDIRVDAPAFLTGNYQPPSSTVDYTDNGAIDYIGFERIRHRDPREDDRARVYVQVHNRGPDSARDVKVRVFYPSKANGCWRPRETAGL